MGDTEALLKRGEIRKAGAILKLVFETQGGSL